jgi:glycosyltransferase involved in cell wall biosynthesis
MPASNSRLRVCVVGELTGGVGVYGQNLLGGLRDAGVDVTVVTPTPEHSPVPQVIPVRRCLGRGRWLPQAREFAGALASMDRGFDVVHFTDARFAVLAGKQSCPVVGTMNDYFYAITGWLSGRGSADIYDDWLLRHAYYNFTRVLEARCLRRLDAVLCIASAVADVLNDRYRLERARLPIVPYGINFGRADVEPMVCTGPMVLFAGGNFQRKGLAVLIDASVQVLRVVPDARFVVVGESADRALMQRRCDQRGVRAAFDFVGQVDYRTLYRYYASARVFAMPSLLEAFGIPYLEAMHCGVPVVASDSAGPDDYLRDGDNCLVARAGDVGALAEQVTRALTDPDLAGRLVGQGRITAARFTVASMVDATIAAYRQVA